MRVAVVGAGLAGLLTAAELRRRGCDVTLLEAGPNVGGVAQTETVDGYLLEPAVGSFVLPDPVLSPLVAAAGTHVTELAGSARRLISLGDGYVELPSGPVSFARTTLLGTGDKLRLLTEPLVRSRTAPDESLTSFLTRRLGTKTGKLAAELTAAGVFGADPADIDAAAFAPLVALEAAHGSVLRGLWARRRTARANSAPRPVMSAPSDGMRAFASELAALAGDVQLGARVQHIELRGDHVLVDGERCDGVVITAPPAAAPVVGGRQLQLVDPPMLDVAVVFLGGPAGDMHLPAAFGLLAGPQAATPILGLLVESIAPGRAPEGHHLAKLIVGGVRAPEIASWSDTEILARTIDDAGRLLGAAIRPVFRLVIRRQIPQYRPGHLARVAATPLPGRITVGGWHQRGIGISSLAADAARIARHSEQWNRA